MVDGKAETVLRRKAEAGRARPDDFAMSPPKALKQALAKAAQDLMDMPLRVPELSEMRVSLAELPESLEDRALLALLDGPGDSMGLVAFSPVVLAGLIEVQTMGRLGASQVLPRKPTRTDAAMVAEFVDHVLSEVEALLAEEADITWAGGYRYASWLEDPRPLGLILEETNYRLFRITTELGAAGTRRGGVMLALPAQGRGPGPRRQGVPGGDAEASAESVEAELARDWAARIERTVMRSEVQVEAVLHRFSLPIREVMGLRPGMVLPVPMDGLERLSIEGVDGCAVAQGRLGQAIGYRAVRLTVVTAEEEDNEGGLIGQLGAMARPAGQTDTLSGRPPFPGATGESAPTDMDMPSRAATGKASPLPGGEGGLAPLAMDGLPPLGGIEEAELPGLPMAPLKMGNGF